MTADLAQTPPVAPADRAIIPSRLGDPAGWIAAGQRLADRAVADLYPPRRAGIKLVLVAALALAGCAPDCQDACEDGFVRSRGPEPTPGAYAAECLQHVCKDAAAPSGPVALGGVR